MGHPGGHPGGHSGGHPAGIPKGHPGGHPVDIPMGHPGGHPGGHPAGIPKGHPGDHPGGHPGQGDNTSSGARSYRPGAGPAAKAFEERTGIKAPRIIAWEITRRCNLLCEHCRASAEECAYPGELTLDECKAVMDDIASITDPILILTGGEPLMRNDIWEIIDYAHQLGLHPVIGTNGTLITDEIATKIAEHGIPRVSISLDFPTAEAQDAFRGKVGAFDEAVAGIEALNNHGVGVQVNTTITKMNVDVIDQVHELANSLGAVAFHPFLLVPTGRGEDLIDVELTPEEYEEVLTWAYHKQQCSPMHFKPTDSPQYYRIIRQQAAKEGQEVTTETYGMEALTRGCLGGITFCFISHVGDVQPCGYFDMQLGNVKEKPFSEIWTTSPVFDDLRHYDRLKGKCGACEYKGVCGGCRARALSISGDYMEEEPYCAYVPQQWVQDRLLNIIQSDFPLVEDPYANLAEQIEAPRDSVVDALKVLRKKGLVRRVGASVAARGVGYVSCLCAAAVEGGQEAIDEAANEIAKIHGVTHDYSRVPRFDLGTLSEDDPRAEVVKRFNVWFTLTAPSLSRIEETLDTLQQQLNCEIICLPASRMHKIRVDFQQGDSSKDARSGEEAPGAAKEDATDAAQEDVSDASQADASGAAQKDATGAAQEDASGASKEENTFAVSPADTTHPFDAQSAFDIALLRWAQGDVVNDGEEGLLENPFVAGVQAIKQATGEEVQPQDIIQRLEQLKSVGAIRRFGAMVRHNKMGYKANAMVVIDVDDAAAAKAGKALAQLPFVSHCYERTRVASWPFNLYAMVHATDETNLAAHMGMLHDTLRSAGIDAHYAVLATDTEYKKVSMRYFEEE